MSASLIQSHSKFRASQIGLRRKKSADGPKFQEAKEESPNEAHQPNNTSPRSGSNPHVSASPDNQEPTGQSQLKPLARRREKHKNSPSSSPFLRPPTWAPSRNQEGKTGNFRVRWDIKGQKATSLSLTGVTSYKSQLGERRRKSLKFE